MPEEKKLGIGTRALHAGQVPDPTTNSRAVPIYQTSSYVFNSSEHAANLFALKEMGNIYTRLMNPTTDVLEKRLAEMDGGVGALAVASGSSADHSGDSQPGPGGRQHRLDQLPLRRHLQPVPLHLRPHGHRGEVRRFVATRRPLPRRSTAGPRRSIPRPSATPKTTWTISKPSPRWPTTTGCPSSSTIQSPPRCCSAPSNTAPISSCYSLTKFIGGHGTSIGGAVVDSGNFDWSSGRFPEYTTPDPSYHGLVYHEALGEPGLHPQDAGYPAAGHGPGPFPVQQLPVPARPGDPSRAHAPSL